VLPASVHRSETDTNRMRSDRTTSRAGRQDSLSREVSEMVERELRERPTFSHRVLQQFAANLAPEIARMDPRRFHAEFIVPAQRRIGATTAPKRKSKSKSRRQSRVGRSRAKPPRPPQPGGASTHAPPREPRAAAPPTEAAAANVRAGPDSSTATERSPAPMRKAGPRVAADRERRRKARAVFFEWARALADADSDAAVIDVLSGVDRYVARFLDDDDR
jgi:hypothetical protein